MCMENPSTPSPGTGMGQTLSAEVKYAPQVYASNATYSPLYTQLGLSNLDAYLNGSNGQPGFLSEYQNQIMPALTSAQTTANTAVRTANLNDAAALTPQYVANERAANPGAAGLLDTLTSDTSRDLSYGTQLTPAEQYQMNQSVRGAQAARGMGYGPSDVFNETFANTNYGQQLYQQRLSDAQGLVPTLQGFYGNPTAAISGMTSNAGMSASNMAAVGTSGAATAQSSEFNPQTDLSNIMSNQLSTSEASAMNNNAAINAGLQAGVGAMSSL